jgi:hypothetical protein
VNFLQKRGVPVVEVAAVVEVTRMQDKHDCDVRARELQLEREERALQACEDHQQQQQFMNMMWMQMMGGKKKARDDSREQKQCRQ